MRFGERDDRDTVAFHARWKFSAKKNPREAAAGTFTPLMRRKTVGGQ